MSTENDIKRIHELFCALTGRAEKLRFAVEHWGIIFRQPEYAYDAAKVEADLRVIVAYLLTAIAEKSRNAGALKLCNFLQADRWFADLAEAQAKLNERKKSNRASAANTHSANSAAIGDY